MLNLPHTYAALAPRLHAAGYAVLPLDSKAPKVPKWSEVAITQQQVEQWAAEKPKANIGLRCDQALMVDIDIEVPAEAQRMTQLILNQFPGGLIRRRGDSSKLALLYRRADLEWRLQEAKARSATATQAAVSLNCSTIAARRWVSSPPASMAAIITGTGLHPSMFRSMS